MKSKLKSKLELALFIGVLGVGSQVQAGVDPSIPATPGFGFAEDVVNFDGLAYFKGQKSTKGSTRTWQFDASNKASNVPGMSGSTYPLFFTAADPSKSYTIIDGIYDLNFKGTTTNVAGPGANCTLSGGCWVEYWGSGISNPDAAWSTLVTTSGLADGLAVDKNSSLAGLQFASSGASQLLFKAKLEAFDIFGETTSTRTDDAIAFRWTDVSGLFAPIADLVNFSYLANINTQSFLGSKVTVSSTQALQHTNVPLPAALYLLGSGLAVLLGRSAFGKRGNNTAAA